MALLNYPFNQRLANLDSGSFKYTRQYIINTNTESPNEHEQASPASVIISARAEKSARNLSHLVQKSNQGMSKCLQRKHFKLLFERQRFWHNPCYVSRGKLP